MRWLAIFDISKQLHPRASKLKLERRDYGRVKLTVKSGHCDGCDGGSCFDLRK